MKNNWASNGSKFALAATGLVPSDTGTFCGLLQLFKNLLSFALEIAVPIAVIAIVYGGFKIMTAGGSPKGEEAGKAAIKSALIGVVIVFGAWIIINTLLNVVGLSLSGANSVLPWTGITC